jgi:hypothetical protein
MKIRFLSLLTLLLSGLMLLSACAPDVPTEAPPEVLPEEPQEEPHETPYPYPAPQVIYNPYPDPQEAIVEAGNTTGNDPYPGIEVEGDAGDLDMAEVLTPADFAVQSNDGGLKTGPVYIDRSKIMMKESYPVQVELVLTGNLPTPCNMLRVVSAEPDENGHIEIEAYTVSDPDKMCAQVLTPFVALVPLGEYTEGAYTISINDVESGDFQLP